MEKPWILYDPARDAIISKHDDIEDLMRNTEMYIDYFKNSGSSNLREHAIAYPQYTVMQYNTETEAYESVCTYASFPRIMKIRKLISDTA